jgi:hypothetical protein
MSKLEGAVVLELDDVSRMRSTKRGCPYGASP